MLGPACSNATGIQEQAGADCLAQTWQVLTKQQLARLIVAAQPYKVDMLSFTLAALGQLLSPASLVGPQTSLCLLCMAVRGLS